MKIAKDEMNASETEYSKRYRKEWLDDLPPTTVITHVNRQGSLVKVRGTTADNGVVKRVVVNGREAKSARPNFAEWEIAFEDVPRGPLKLKAYAEDEAKNVEPCPHIVLVPE